MVTSVSDIRTVPVGEDLTQENLSLSVLRGLERMHRVDKKSEPALSLVSGEWGVLGNDNTVGRPGSVPVAATYLCFLGTDRFDAKASGQVTLIMNSPVIVKSNKFNSAGSYVVGTYLTVKDLGGGEASVTPASAGEYAVAKVNEVGQGYLVYEVIPVPFKV